jgi:predicted ATPase
MGINTGAAQAGVTEERAGGYVGYSTLARTQRVMSTAHGGQVLLSNPTAELVRGELPVGVTLRDMGEHRLKGLVNLEHLWQLVAPDLRQDFPPLPSLNAIPNNLPVQLTSFVGREKDIAEVKRLLSSARLVTLTGSGGAGKTRLSLQVAAEVIDDFAHGVWFVELAALTDPTLIPQTVASVLGLREESGRPLMTLLTEYLRAKAALIILDNCEHLIEGCAQFADTMLRAAPQVKLLTSSREALSIGGEATYRVPSLAAPDPQHMPPLEALTQYDAVRLFIERSKAVAPSFEIKDVNASAVIQLCYHLDGIPLAIELAAARMRGMKVEQIAQRLDDRFRLLTSGSRTTLPHHQTLRALIDWSYNLLADHERTLFRRLSVFAGGWTIEAAEVVCAGDGLESFEVLDSLLRLADKSLVIMDELSDHARYRMLETIREYAYDRLREAAEVEQVRARHLAYSLALVEEAEPHFLSADVTLWLSRVDQELENIRAALGWSFENGEAESALRLAGALWWFWRMRGQISEGRKWLEGALTLPGAGAQSPARGKVLQGAVIFARYQGDYEREAATAEECLRFYRTVGDLRGVAEALNLLGAVAMFREDYTTAHAYIEEGLTLCRELHDQVGIARLLNLRGELARCQQDFTRACACYEQSLLKYRKLGRTTEMAITLLNYGHAELGRGAFPEAFERLKQSLFLYRELNIKQGLAECVIGLGEIAVSLRQPKRAVTLFGAAESLSEGISHHLDRPDLIQYEQALARLRNELDDTTLAATWATGRALTMEQAIELAVSNE